MSPTGSPTIAENAIRAARRSEKRGDGEKRRERDAERRDRTGVHADAIVGSLLKRACGRSRRLLWRWPPSRNELQQVVAVVLVEAGPKTLL